MSTTFPTPNASISLCSCPSSTDPVAITEVLTVKDRSQLRARVEMADPDERAWASLTPEAADRGRAAYRLLVG